MSYLGAMTADAGKKRKMLTYTTYWVFMDKVAQLFSVHQLQLCVIFLPSCAFWEYMFGHFMLRCSSELDWRFVIFLLPFQMLYLDAWLSCVLYYFKYNVSCRPFVIANSRSCTLMWILYFHVLSTNSTLSYFLSNVGNGSFSHKWTWYTYCHWCCC